MPIPWFADVFLRLWRLALKSPRLRHLAVAIPITGLYGLLLLLNQLARLLDLILFPGYREQPLEAPIYIVATPRSGTTFLHRLLTYDERFTAIALYQTVLPSILWDRLLTGIAALDRRIGGPGAWLLERLDRLAFGGWEGIHETGFARSEEDEMLWLYPLASPALVLLFPWPDALQDLAAIDTWPGERRRRLAAYYRDSLQRILYTAPRGRTLLAKNALAGGRIATILEAVPDARFVHLVRHPYEAIPSMLSMFYLPMRFHSPWLRKDGPEMRILAEWVIASYRTFHALAQELPPERYLAIRYDTLISDPMATVERIYDHFGWPLDTAVRERLARGLERARRWRSRHRYTLAEYGLDPKWIQAELAEIFVAHGFAENPEQYPVQPHRA